jgi:hypothetical protein
VSEVVKGYAENSKVLEDISELEVPALLLAEISSLQNVMGNRENFTDLNE